MPIIQPSANYLKIRELNAMIYYMLISIHYKKQFQS